MKYSLSLLLGAVLSLGALPSTASARTVVVVENHHSHARFHRVYHRAHWVRHHGHRVLIPAHWVTVRS